MSGDVSDSQSLRALFDSLIPRLEAARQLESELDVALARRFNVFDFLDRSELGLSRIVAELLDVNGRHGQGALFLEKLLDKLTDQGSPVTQSDIEGSSTEVEFTIKNGRRIDVIVSLGDSCLAIENKPYTGDQSRQVHDYLVWLKQQYKKFWLVYLSPASEPPSDGSVTLDELRQYGTKDFKILAYAGGELWGDDYDDFRLEYSLVDWFAECQSSCGVDRLRWFLREAELFCRHRFGGEVVTDNERNALMEFVLESDERLRATSVIHQSWPAVKERVVRLFYDVLWKAEPKDDEYIDYDLWWYDTGYSDAPRSAGKCYLYMTKDTWRIHDGWTQIRLQNSSPGPNNWFIGIYSPVALSQEPERRRRYEELQKHLDANVAPTETPGDYWPWWIWVDNKYRYWNDIVPALNEECKERGEITDYFVDKLVAIANAATRRIDKIEA